MITERYQGDPRITIDQDGADLVFRAGQPVMDRGIENAVLISLLTEPGWPGNVLADTPSQKIGGRFLEATRQPITATALTDVRSAILSDLKWMVDDGLVEEIDAEVTNPEAKKLQVVIAVKPPGSDLQAFLLTNNGLLWTNQLIDPANERV